MGQEADTNSNVRIASEECGTVLARDRYTGVMPSDAQNKGRVTALLDRIRAGDPSALNDLYPIVYEELHTQAQRFMRDERHGHTLQPTALVHEVYVRLLEDAVIDCECSAHFYRAAARAMRQVLVDHARSRRRKKRGGGKQRVSLDNVDVGSFDPDANADEIMSVHEALERLESEDPRASEVACMKYFGGMTFEQIGTSLRISGKTAMRDWEFARAKLYRDLTQRGYRP